MVEKHNNIQIKNIIVLPVLNSFVRQRIILDCILYQQLPIKLQFQILFHYVCLLLFGLLKLPA